MDEGKNGDEELLNAMEMDLVNFKMVVNVIMDECGR